MAVPAGASSWVLRLIFGPLGKLANLRRWLLDIVPAAPQVLQPLDAAIYEPDETKREAILARTKAADRSETYAAATRPRPPKWSAN